MNYFKLSFSLDPIEPFRDILIAQLGDLQFESFVETETGFDAYIAQDLWSDDWNLNEVDRFPDVQVSYSKELVQDQNWNEEWEKNFDPILIGDECYIRATFHEAMPQFPYEIVITPKMSFGTGHHQTTTMMVQLALEMGFDAKDVLDMGAGTAVLAILAGMKGAKDITAIDIDEWAFENAKENVAMNGYEKIKVFLGGAEVLGNENYDIIFANINRNILLEDIPAYTQVLNTRGKLLLSGFYQEDIPLIQDKCASVGLKLEKSKNIDNWAALQFEN
ncbi:MAG: 50S ribosomal protein L11 methyltransferase [Schleiferiaceae bacterium]|jgi:ribosomal protein L11 methyltransferase|nr:50S ribosomal protein L11 methyltransferase [Schleiferiaceae bacterium]